MNTLQNVYNKLNSKTELEKHNVELSLFEDYSKAVDALREQTARANSIKNEAKPIIKSSMDKFGMAQFAFDRAVKYVLDIDKKIKDLGVPADEKFGAAVQRMYDEEKKIKEVIEILSKIQKDLNF